MLSFMKEQGFGASGEVNQPGPENASQPNNEDAEPKQQRNPQAEETTAEKSEEYLTVASRGKVVRKTNLLLAGLFGIALIGVLVMIKNSRPVAVASPRAADEAQMSLTINRLTEAGSEMFGAVETTVKKFYESSDAQQVRVNELVKNPFVLETSSADSREKAAIGEGSILEAERIRKLRMQQQADRMRLLIIIQSSQGNCCMIDDEVLYQGDLINGFRIKQIADSFVRLEWLPGSYEQQGAAQSQPMETILRLTIDD